MNMLNFSSLSEGNFWQLEKAQNLPKVADLRDENDVTDNEPHFNSLCQLKEDGEWK